jgi:streptogramin lyase
LHTNGKFVLNIVGSKFKTFLLKLDENLTLLNQETTNFTNGLWGLAANSNEEIFCVYSPLHGYNLPPESAGKHQVIKIDNYFSIVSLFGNERGSGNFKLDSPTGICVDNNNNIYVTDNSNNRIVKLNPSLTYLSEFKFNSLGDQINSVAFRGNKLYAAMYGGALKIMDSSFNDLNLGSQNAFQFGVQSIAIDSQGRVWAAGNVGVEVFDPISKFKKTFLKSDLGLTRIGGLSFDSKGYMYLTDQNGIFKYLIK